MSGLIVGLVLRTPVTPNFDQGAKFVAVVYADHAWDDGTNAYPAVETVAGIIGCSGRTVQRHIRTLQRLGLLVAYGKGPRGQTKYRFPLQTGADGFVRLAPPAKLSPRQIVTPRGDTDSGDTDSGDTPVTQTINPSFKNKEEDDLPTLSAELQRALTDAGIFKPCWAGVTARLADGWTERDILALLSWMRGAGGSPGRFVARVREGTRAPGRYYPPPTPAGDEDETGPDPEQEPPPPSQPDWWLGTIDLAFPYLRTSRPLRDALLNATVEFTSAESADGFTAVRVITDFPKLDVLQDRLGRTLLNTLRGQLGRNLSISFVSAPPALSQAAYRLW